MPLQLPVVVHSTIWLIQEGQLSFLAKECAQYLEDKAYPVNVWLGKLILLDMTPLGWLGCKASTQTNPLAGITISYLLVRLTNVWLKKKTKTVLCAVFKKKKKKKMKDMEISFFIYCTIEDLSIFSPESDWFCSVYLTLHAE